MSAASIIVAASANAAVITGTITDWAESATVETIGDNSNSVNMYWSINTFDKGFFYGSGFTGDSDVAVATGITDVSQITDASIFSFTSGATPAVCDADCDPDGVGAFLVYRNTSTNYYAAVRVDDIRVFDINVPEAEADLTWWFQTDGSSSFAVPLPAGGLLLLSALVGLGLAHRKDSQKS